MILAPLTLLAQAGLEPSWGGIVQQLGVAGVATALLGWQLGIRVKELREKDEKIREKDEELRETNRKLLELAERTLPVLAEASRLLSDSPRRQGDQPGSEEFRSALRRLETIAEDLSRDRRRGEP